MGKNIYENLQLSDWEMFDCELACLRHRVSSLLTSISSGLHQSRLWSYNQKRAQEKICSELEEFLRITQNWSFYRDIVQKELDFTQN